MQSPAHLFCLSLISTAAEKRLTRNTGTTANIMQVLAKLLDILFKSTEHNSTGT